MDDPVICTQISKRFGALDSVEEHAEVITFAFRGDCKIHAPHADPRLARRPDSFLLIPCELGRKVSIQKVVRQVRVTFTGLEEGSEGCLAHRTTWLRKLIIGLGI